MIGPSELCSKNNPTMATVHPSRLGLIPKDLRPQNNSQDISPPRRRHSRSQSPRRYSRDRDTKADRYHGRDRDRDRSRGRNLYSRRDERRDYDSRRTSPKYDDYRFAPEGFGNSRSQRRMYPERGGGGRYGDHFSGNADHLAR